MKRVRVFFVLPVMKGGGAEQVASLLLNHLDRERFEPALVLFNREGEYLERVPEDVEVFDLKKSGRLGFFALIGKLRRLVDAERPDVLLSSLYYPNIITVLANRRARAPAKVIVSEHSNHKVLLRYKRASRLARRLMAYTYRRADRIVTVSRCLKDDLVADFAIPGERFRIIYNPAERDAVRRLAEEEAAHPLLDAGREGKMVISSVGRLTRAKNFEMLLQAVQLARREVPAVLLLAGHGELEGELKGLARRLELDGCVDFLGYQANPYKWMKRSDLFVLPSTWEGFGIVIVEAQMLGVPVIATACHGGTNEIVEDGVNGRVVPVGDARALAAAMVELGRDPAARDRLAAAALRTSERYDVAQIVPAYEETIVEVAAGR